MTHVGQDAPSRSNVFVISPIGNEKEDPEHYDHFMQLYRHVICEALPPAKWLTCRADEDKSADSVSRGIISRIVQADLVVAVLTGANPNVYYELAIAHAYDLPVISLIEEGGKIAFDVYDQRVIWYDISRPGRVKDVVKEIEEQARWVEEHPGQSFNPVRTYKAGEAFLQGLSEGGGFQEGDSMGAMLLALAEIREAIRPGEGRWSVDIAETIERQDIQRSVNAAIAHREPESQLETYLQRALNANKANSFSYNGFEFYVDPPSWSMKVTKKGPGGYVFRPDVPPRIHPKE